MESIKFTLFILMNFFLFMFFRSLVLNAADKHLPKTTLPKHLGISNENLVTNKVRLLQFDPEPVYYDRLVSLDFNNTEIKKATRLIDGLFVAIYQSHPKSIDDAKRRINKFLDGFPEYYTPIIIPEEKNISKCVKCGEIKPDVTDRQDPMLFVGGHDNTHLYCDDCFAILRKRK